MTFDWSKAKIARRHVEPQRTESHSPRRRFDGPADAPLAKAAAGHTLWDFIDRYMPAARQLALSQTFAPSVEPDGVDTSSSLKL